MGAGVVTALLDLEGVAQRASTFRFDLLDERHQAVGEVHPVAGASVSNDGSRAVHRSLSGFKLPAAEAGDVDVLTARLRPSMVLSDGSAHPLGVYVFADASWSQRSYGRDLAATLVDEGLLLDQEADRILSFAPGTAVSDALGVVLSLSPITRWWVDPSPVVLSAWATWPRTTTWLAALTDLCKLAALWPPYFNNVGDCLVVAVPDLASTQPLTTYEAGGRIVDGSVALSDDLLDAPNRYRVVNTGSADTPIVGIWDVPASAPHSIARRGFVITKTAQMQGVADVAAATAAAKALGQQSSAGYATGSFGTPPDPRHDTHDVLRFLGSLWLEQGWTLQLAEGATMRHTVRRVYG